MLYLFLWNSDYLLKEQIRTWKTKFLEKNWDFNLLHIKDISEVDNNFLIENMTSMSFFDSKKLIIVDNMPLAQEKSTNLKAKQDFLLNILDKIPDDNIVVFNSLNPDKRSKFYKKLIKIAEHKDLSIKSDNDLVNIIKKRYWNIISIQAINLIIKYKAWDLTRIFSELDKLFIIYDYLDSKEISENIIPEPEESIFQFIDDLLNLNFKEAFLKMSAILEQTNVYAFYNNFIANLRVQVFIEKLKSSSESSHDIVNILWLWNRAFLVNKSYKISQKKLEDLYIWLVNLDKKMKTWSMIASEDDVFISEIDNCILKIKA